MGRAIYVSSVNGDDANSGYAPEKAFRSLRKVNQMEIQPGDQILLERGSVFVGEYLHLYRGGTKEAPIVVDAYGEGELPRIEADGNGIWYQNYGGHLDNVVHTWKGYLSSAVLLYDAEYITVRNLEITNDPLIKNECMNQADRMNRTGVSVIAQNHGTLHQIELAYLYVHDVEGNIYDKHLNNGGIYMSVSRPDDEEKTGIARYDGIHIHHCKVENCRRWGIAAGYTYQHDKFTTLELPDEVVKTYGSTNVVIEHNFVKDIGGDGITPMYCFEPLIQYNVSENIAVDIHPDLYNEEGNRGGMTAAAIWPWKCKTALFQYNEAYNTVYNQDGQAWDADSGDGTIYQYNYSCNNGGGCVMFCEGESVNNIFRYNISQNDGTGILTPVRNVDAKIYGNIFYIKEGVDFIRHRIWGDTMIEGGGIEVTDNTIIYAGNTPKEESWTYNSPKAYYQNNTYVNYQNTPEGDTAPICLSTATEILTAPGIAPETTNGSSRMYKGSQDFAGYRLKKDGTDLLKL